MNLEKLGRILREKREDLGIPAKTVAEKAEIGRSTLWIWEEGENPKTGKPSRPSKDNLERVMAVLRLDPDEQAELLELAGYNFERKETSTQTPPKGIPSHLIPPQGAFSSPGRLTEEHPEQDSKMLQQSVNDIIDASGLSPEGSRLAKQSTLEFARMICRVLKETEK